MSRLGVMSEVPDEEVSFLRENSIFDVLSTQSLKLICAMGEPRKLEIGGTLFKSGDPCSTFYVVSEGVVEIRRPREEGEEITTAAYSGVGDVLCGMGILTSSCHRSTAEAPDGAEVLAISRELLQDIMFLFPQLAIGMYTTIANRLASTVENEGFRSNSSKLQGSLDHFDLATVLQSVVFGDGRCGQILIFDHRRRMVARIQFGDGRVSAAEFGDHSGCDAINRMFQADLSSHTFSYIKPTDSSYEMMVSDSELLESSGTGLLLNAARLADEERHASCPIPGPDEEAKSLVRARVR